MKTLALVLLLTGCGQYNQLKENYTFTGVLGEPCRQHEMSKIWCVKPVGNNAYAPDTCAAECPAATFECGGALGQTQACTLYDPTEG